MFLLKDKACEAWNAGKSCVAYSLTLEGTKGKAKCHYVVIVPLCACFSLSGEISRSGIDLQVFT